MTIESSADAPQMPWPVIPVALSTASVYPLGCAAGFSIAAELGFDGVEVMVWNDATSRDVDALMSFSDRHQQPIVALHAPTLLVSQHLWGTTPWPKITKVAQMAQTMGVEVVVAHPPFRWQRDYATQFVRGIKEVEDRYGIKVAVENMFPWRSGQRQILAYSPGWDPVREDYRHVTLDGSHAATAGSDLLAMTQELGPRLAHVHLADGSGSRKDEHLVPGRGTQPCGPMLQLLAERGWHGSVVVEVNTRRAKSPASRKDDLIESLAFARHHLNQGYQRRL